MCDDYRHNEPVDTQYPGHYNGDDILDDPLRIIHTHRTHPDTGSPSSPRGAEVCENDTGRCTSIATNEGKGTRIEHRLCFLLR